MSKFNANDEYDDYEEVFDDVADDWELEAEMEERQAAAEAAAEAERKEGKLNTRAPVIKHAVVDVEEETLPDKVQRELEVLRQDAHGLMATSDFMGDSSAEKDLLYDTLVENKEQAIQLGITIANRILKYYARENYDDVLCAIFDNITHDFEDEKLINKQITRTHVVYEEIKRSSKGSKNKREIGPIQGVDAFGFDNVNDQGGAAAIEDEPSPFEGTLTK